jgi:RNA-directed DNA polymerase
MHENREISSTPWCDDQGRSAKAINRNVDMHVLEKSDCAVVPVNQPNKEAKASAEAGEGRAQMKKNIAQLHIDLLRDSFYALQRKASPGVDGVTWQEYETGLEDRIIDLYSRVHRGAYRAQPSRRVYIPKADGRQRPLASRRWRIRSSNRPW